MIKMKSIAGQGNFRLLRNDEIIFALLHNAQWPSRNATAVCNSQTIVIKPKSSWRKSYLIEKSNVLCGRISANWDGEISIELKRSDSQGLDKLILEKRGFLKRSYHLFTAQHKALLVFESQFNWTTLQYDYSVKELSHIYPHEAINELLVYAGFAVNLSAVNAR